MADPMNPLWPELNYDAWPETRATLQLWTQIIGKIRLMQTPWLNHSWHVPLYVNSKGLTTSPIATDPAPSTSSSILSSMHSTSRSATAARAASPCGRSSVADFYGAVMAALAELGIAVAINEKPCEIAGATPFSQDRTHAAYDPQYARRFWQILLQSDRVLKNIPHRLPRQVQPRAFLLGELRSRGHTLLRPPCPALYGHGPGSGPGGNARSLLP